MSSNIDLRPTAAMIDLNALADNFQSAKHYIGADLNYMAVVKADGYGHGAAACALRLESEGVDWFGVALPEEGVELRLAGIKRPILCLGSFWPGQEHLIVKHRLTPVIGDERSAVALNLYSQQRQLTTDIHVKIDTGMGRVGIDHHAAAAFASSLGALAGLRVTGILTHFAAAESAREDEFTNLQIERFSHACEAFRAAGHTPELVDLANSPAAIRHPASRGNLVRLGGALYGLIDDILAHDTDRPVLRPVMSLVSKIAHLRSVKAGESLGYGRSFVTKCDSLIALVPIGYADGYPRGLSNRGRASVRGQFIPVVGRISMDWTLFDVTGVEDVAVDDQIFLIGGADSVVKASDLAGETGTIGYEITCGVSPRVPRIYVQGPLEHGQGPLKHGPGKHK